jgi:hypothetical protein
MEGDEVFLTNVEVQFPKNRRDCWRAWLLEAY